MRTIKRMIVGICLLSVISVDAQPGFDKKLNDLMNKSIRAHIDLLEKIDSKVSEVVFVQYDLGKKTIELAGDTGSAYYQFTRKVIDDEVVRKYILDAATSSFVQPIFYSVLIELKDWNSDHIVFSKKMMYEYFNQLKKIKQKRNWNVLDEVVIFTEYPQISSRD